MGSGKWDDAVYYSSVKSRVDSGTPHFAYSATTHAAPAHTHKAHVDLDPKQIKDVREARDSDEHPETVPVAVLFDVTGSMHQIPQVFQEKLTKLMTILTTKGQLDHPQVLFGAIGDAHVDRVPFQVGQFESDNRCDEQLRNVFLEGGGGGQHMESYGLAYYFAGWKTATDAWEKRGKKGYLFTLGDETFWNPITAEEIKKIFGDKLESDLTVEAALEKAQTTWEVYHIHVVEGSYPKAPEVLGPWKKLLGERLIQLEDQNLVCELIASTVALLEGADIRDVASGLGLDDKGVKTISTALTKVGSAVPVKAAKLEGKLPVGTSKAKR